MLPDPPPHPKSKYHRIIRDVIRKVPIPLLGEASIDRHLLVSFDAAIHSNSLPNQRHVPDPCTSPKELLFSPRGPRGTGPASKFDLGPWSRWGLQMLTPQVGGERPLTQILYKLIKTSFFIHVHRLSPPKVKFKRSALDTEKIRVFIAQKLGVSKWWIWWANRQSYRVTYA